MESVPGITVAGKDLLPEDWIEDYGGGGDWRRSASNSSWMETYSIGLVD
jgi:hypothetical protein